MTEATLREDEATALRASILRRLGASNTEIEELLRYNANAFRVPAPGELPPLPLPDEPFVAAWEGYAAEAAERGVWPVLRERLPQLRFPIEAGVSATEAYLAATRRGELPPQDTGAGVVLARPERLRLFLHPTAAGRLPVLLAGDRDDFVALVRALARRNEPDPIPASMGACMVSGYVSWDRVARLRERFEAGEREAFGGAADWKGAFAWVRERREMYQDCFVLLSAGAYSGVPAAEMGMDDDAWREASVAIRREHECAHYFTRRVLGSARNALHDELAADYAGIVAAAGRYRAEWFLRFLGLEDPHGYREGGRLQNYRSKPPLSDGAFTVLQALVRRAAAQVEAFDRGLSSAHRTVEGRARVLLALASLTLEELADEGAAERLRSRVQEGG
jgi:hypothetical protein